MDSRKIQFAIDSELQIAGNPQEGRKLDASTTLHRHDQLAKYHPVPWLRWPNLSWHQVFRLPLNLSWTYRESIVNLSWTYPEPSYGASIVNLSQIYEPIVNLSWTYPRCQPFEVCLKNSIYENHGIWSEMGPYGSVWAHIKTARSPMAQD